MSSDMTYQAGRKRLHDNARAAIGSQQVERICDALVRRYFPDEPETQPQVLPRRDEGSIFCLPTCKHQYIEACNNYHYNRPGYNPPVPPMLEVPGFEVFELRKVMLQAWDLFEYEMELRGFILEEFEFPRRYNGLYEELLPIRISPD